MCVGRSCAGKKYRFRIKVGSKFDVNDFMPLEYIHGLTKRTDVCFLKKYNDPFCECILCTGPGRRGDCFL